MSDGDSADIVPFGKYKGQPIANLVADQNYTDWLAAQPWFREKFGNVYNLIINQVVQPQDTPEHNALQARFLDHDQVLRIARSSVLPARHSREVAKWSRMRDQLPQEQKDNVGLAELVVKIGFVKFEHAGWDLVAGMDFIQEPYEVSETSCVCVCDTVRCRETPDDLIYKERRSGGLPIPNLWSACVHWNGGRVKHCNPTCRTPWYTKGPKYEKCFDKDPSTDGWLAVELKPLLGDDYPSVLRTVTKRYENDRQDNAVPIVLVERAEFGGGVTLDQVRKIYHSQLIQLVVINELPPVEESWRCGCHDCQPASYS